LRRNPRLREYDPCLRCGDLRTSSGVQRVRRGRAAVEENRRREENVFEIGDEDDEDVTHGDDMDSANRGPPPAYDDREGRSGGGEGDADARTHDHDDRHTQRSTSQSGSARGGVRSRSSSRRSAGSVHRDGHESRPDRQDADLAGVEVRDGIDDDPLQVVEVRHPVSRGDTLLAIARKYAADVSVRQASQHAHRAPTTSERERCAFCHLPSFVCTRPPSISEGSRSRVRRLHVLCDMFERADPSRTTSSP